MGSLTHLDSMVFIYFLDNTNTKFHQASFAVIKDILRGEIQAITSNISVIETLSLPQLSSNEEKIDEYTLFFNKTTNLTVFPIGWDISLEAARLRRINKNLRTPDAIQLATAIIHKADIFITNDKKILSLTSFPVKLIPLDKYK